MEEIHKVRDWKRGRGSKGLVSAELLLFGILSVHRDVWKPKGENSSKGSKQLERIATHGRQHDTT